MTQAELSVFPAEPATVNRPTIITPPAGHSETLRETYDRWFRVIDADNPRLRDQAHRLRYQVYCVENAYEDPADNPGEREYDKYDSHSVHSLLEHVPTGNAAGAVRLVLPSTSYARRGLPIHEICDHPLLDDVNRLPPHKTAEISRFSISKNFRRRREDGRYPNMATPMSREALREERRIMPHMTLGLMNAIVRMSVANDITHWTAVMEPALLRLLSRLGIRFEPLGPIVNYHGRRQPVYADAGQLLAGIWATNREVWEVITDDGSLWPLKRQGAVA